MPIVFADKLRIGEVIQNLLENAIKFCGEANQPRIEISATLELTDDLKTVTSNSTSEDYLSKDFNVESHIDYRIIATPYFLPASG